MIVQYFRDADGSPVLSDASTLTFSIRDFEPAEISKDVPDTKLELGASTLCQYLNEAEVWDRKSRSGDGIAPTKIKRKYREDIPPEFTGTDEEEEVEDTDEKPNLEQIENGRRHRRRTVHENDSTYKSPVASSQSSV